LPTDSSRYSQTNPNETIAQRTLAALKEARSRIETLERDYHEPIAVIGMACRFPGQATSPDRYWELLDKGQHAISDFPEDRWDVDAFYDPNPDVPGKIYTRKGAFLDQVDSFDSQFFGIPPREAVCIDPQHRLLLEVSWEALENAWQSPEHLAGSRTGVFVGIGQNDYEKYRLFANNPALIDIYDATGCGFCFASGRLSYFYDFQGPTMSIDTACSSSLVALHQACTSLQARECDLALAGGVQIMLKPETGIYLSRIKVLSPNGRCKTFDASADGYGRGEGCGIVVLRRLSEATARGERILAVIRGSAVNHDGASSGMTAPNGLSQQALLRQAVQNAGIDPVSMDYVEAHGTGTPLGDPVEVNALAAVLGPGRTPDRPLWIGSVKTNINHLESAAGIAGVIKVILSLQHERIPAHLLFSTPTPHIAWDRIPVRITDQPLPWPAGGDHPRRAGVSAFGISGTNAHVIIEEAPMESEQEAAAGSRSHPPEMDRPLHVLPLSARSPEALTELIQRYRDYLIRHPDLNMADICFSAAAGRSHFPHRAAAVAGSTQVLTDMLADRAVPSSAPSSGFYQGKVLTPRPGLVFLFTGQGSQYPGMGKQLYDHEPEFRHWLDRCRDILSPLLGLSLTDLLFFPASADFSIHDTAYTQPALFALEYSLAKMWQSWGIAPAALMGHSVGEYVAACIAGVFSLEDALMLIASRGRLIQSLPKTGGMLAVLADPLQVSAAIAPFAGKLETAAFNGPRNVVVSGDQESIRILAQQVKLQGISAIPLQVSHAFHSFQMEPMLADFLHTAERVQFHEPKRTVISNVTGLPADRTIASASYWADHIRRPVRFADSIDCLYKQGYKWFLEVGPQPVLMGMGKQCISDASVNWLPSLRQGSSDWQTLFNAAAHLYVHGFPVNWADVDKGNRRTFLPLPTYPFQRRRFWIEQTPVPARDISQTQVSGISHRSGLAESSPVHPLIDERIDSPALNVVLFQKRFSPTSLRYLSDHRIFKTIVVPGAFHISMALGAAGHMRSGHEIVLENLMFPQALALSDQDICTLQVILTPEDNDRYSFRLGRIDDGGDSWSEHAAGRISFLPRTAAPSRTVDIEMLKQRCLEKIDGAAYYQRMTTNHIHLGPQFQWIETIWRGRDEAVGRMRVPAGLDALASYEIHPSLADACFQISVSLLSDQDTRTMVPSTVDRFHFIGSPRSRENQQGLSHLWCHIRNECPDDVSGGLLASLQLMDDDGHVVAVMDRFIGLEANPEVLLRGLRSRNMNWRYFPVWQPDASEPLPFSMDAASFPLSGTWLIFADSGGLGQRLAEYLLTQGAQPHLVYAREMFQPTNDSVDSGAMEALLSRQGSVLRSVVYLWHLDTADSAFLENNRQLPGLNGVLSLFQALMHASLSVRPDMWIVTRGTQAAGSAPIDPWQAPVWGLSRVLRMEFPDLTCRCIDLDTPNPDRDIQALCQEVTQPDHEDQIAWRNGRRLTLRLMRRLPSVSRHAPEDFRLEITALGQLENLHIAPVERRLPGPEEVEISVTAAGLNFKDVLHALGMLQALTPDGKPVTASEMQFGLEAVGVISAVGEQVAGFAVGEVVMAGVTRGSLGSRVIVPTAFICSKPVHISDTAAATLPVVFLTAWYGLMDLAQIGPQDRVLIHAAAGGVGQAAIQLVQETGAEIFATARPSKWDMLKSQGITHIFNSRTLDFADEIMQVTGGKGVTVILNSLGDEFIAKNVDILAPGGRFIEIGRIGIWDREKMHRIRPDVIYHNFELGELSSRNPALISRMMQHLQTRLQEGRLQPISHQVFPMTEAIDAFRLMAQGKHIGKVVLARPESSESMIRDSSGRREPAHPHRIAATPDSAGTGHQTASSDMPIIRAEATYLITGGLGSLGRITAECLIESGARHLILVGRSALSEEADRWLKDLQENGVRIRAIGADIGKPADAARVLSPIPGWPPLRGIVHAAGILDDGVIAQQSWPRFLSVMEPKVWGTWHLHSLSRNLPLDFFVCFSSIASLLGSPGQSNYAAANAFMDALMHHRRQTGLPGLSINWGPWGQVGMAAGLETRDHVRWKDQGMQILAPESALHQFTQLLKEQPWPQVGVVDVNWHRYAEQLSGTAFPFLTDLLQRTSRSILPVSAWLRDDIQSLPDAERMAALTNAIRQQIARILGASTDDIGMDQGFFELGMDSLTSVELRNFLQTALGSQIPLTLTFDYPTIERLAQHLLTLVFTDRKPEPSAPSGRPEDTPYRPQTATVSDDMSDDELEKLLDARLSALENRS
jgi:acyl transferase domain-containing protein/acyl carrier protein